MNLRSTLKKLIEQPFVAFTEVLEPADPSLVFDFEHERHRRLPIRGFADHSLKRHAGERASSHLLDKVTRGVPPVEELCNVEMTVQLQVLARKQDAPFVRFTSSIVTVCCST